MNGVNSLLLVTRRRREGEREKKKKRGNVYTILEEQRDSLDSICMRLIGRTYLPELLSLKADVFFRKTPAVWNWRIKERTRCLPLSLKAAGR